MDCGLRLPMRAPPRRCPADIWSLRAGWCRLLSRERRPAIVMRSRSCTSATPMTSMSSPRSIVNDCDEAQDITRQVFAELFGMIGEYQEREAPFPPWLQRVARNVAVDHLRAPCPPLAQEVSASTNVVPRRVSR